MTDAGQAQQEKVVITRLTIKIGDVTVQISKEEAKQLKEALDEIFPAQVAPVQIHWHHDPVYYPGTEYHNWYFSSEIPKGDITVSEVVDSYNTCHATLEIKPEGNIIT